jgi:hypothetical protein
MPFRDAEAQAEPDKAFNERLPEHSDTVSLPCLSALVEEVYQSIQAKRVLEF